MSGSVNKVILVGNIGRDPEFTASQGGQKFCRISVATSEKWRDKSTGERKEQTEWTRVVIFNERLVEVAEKFLRKGSKIYLEGQLQTRKWQDKDGSDRYSTEVVLGKFRGELTMLDSKGDGDGRQGGDDYQRPSDHAGQRSGAMAAGGGTAAMLSDDIPFAPW